VNQRVHTSDHVESLGGCLAEDGAAPTESQAPLGHESLNTSQGYIDATANQTRQAAPANRTYQTLRQLQLRDR
jgi:hypothetical protein